MRIFALVLVVFTLALGSPLSTGAATLTTNTTVTGDASILGTLSKGSGSFVIDHPLEPENKLLYHSFAEASYAMNMYDGTATFGPKGEAVVALPDYFEALNKNFRYQLKPIGVPMPRLYVEREVSDNRFVIGGGVPGGKVSWQVTGERRDPYILANPIVPEVGKGPDALVDEGEYLFPAGYQLRSSFMPLVEMFDRLFGFVL